METVKSTDLRIGNRFIRELRTHNKGWEYDPDFILTEEMMGKLFSDDTSLALQDLSPIPITGELLLKWGFIWSELALFYYHKNYNKIYVSLRNPLIKHLGNAYGILVEVDYLHDLQNIFYILTKTELEINL